MADEVSLRLLPGGAAHPPEPEPGPLGEPLRRVLGGRTAAVLAKRMGIHTVGDLLAHLPRRYAQRGELTDIAALRPDEDVTVFAEVHSASSRKMAHRRGTVQEIVVTDGRDKLWLTFFNQPFRVTQLHLGVHGMFAGRVQVHAGRRQLTHPQMELLNGAVTDVADIAEFAFGVIPVYPATTGLTSWQIASCVRTVLDTLGELPDPVPEQVRRRHGLVSLREAFQLVHRPLGMGDWEPGWHRLRWEEAFVLQVVLAQRRAAAAASPAIPRRPAPDGLLAAFDAALPFRLTAGQREVCATLLDELAGTRPMARLLQGEVGSGKTVVALRAMLAVVDAGGQAALLAPTEVLAYQHYRTLTALMGPLAAADQLGGAERGTQVALVTGAQTAAEHRRTRSAVASGAAGIVVGTHALLEDPVQFADLGLVVVDEQHRFGVEQRDALRGKADTPPHLLVMTATPIPRTVAMTVFGDLDVSTLTELPLGRAGVSTHVVPAAERPHFLTRAWERVREEVVAGHQAYVVCPRVGDEPTVGSADDEAEPPGGPELLAAPGGPIEEEPSARVLKLPVARPASRPYQRHVAPRPMHAVLDVAAELAAGPLAGLRLAILHGRLPADVKDQIMRAFSDGQIDVLVATTVIEVGVDVPNATAIVVLDADRFGFSQLHQLRGRIGRGDQPGVALLVTDTPVGNPGRDRLEAVAATADGFELARLDLEARREGDVLGAAQSGEHSSLRLVRVTRDEEIIVAARAEALALVGADAALDHHETLRAALARITDTASVDFLDKA